MESHKKTEEFVSLKAGDTEIRTLGNPQFTSPLANMISESPCPAFINDNDRVLVNTDAAAISEMLSKGEIPPSFELAGPRGKIFFDPEKTACGLVTCGGLCPGLNDIIRAIVLELFYRYGVKSIYGFRYGLQGFIPEYSHEPVALQPENVGGILNLGGSILGSSRGSQNPGAIIDTLVKMGINILFMTGGDGTLSAAMRLESAIRERNLPISVIGIPKTIDNDIFMVSRSFGFDTAVDVATNIIKAAHNEAAGFPNGIGLVKLMGRYSGFIAATAALAQQDVNFVLIPEVDFDLEGENGLFTRLEKRLQSRGHAVIVAAEGAGQKFLAPGNRTGTDKSGNPALMDIGIFLKDRITEYFSEKNIDISMKYIDPSYTVRSLKANANDSVFCGFLARDAVHAGMAGKTGMLVGHWNGSFVHIPMKLSAGRRKQVNPKGKLWHTVLESTGQGTLMNGIGCL